MYNYCTLFNSNYLTRGLAMYESLKKHSKNFHLYIFAFDAKSYKLLKKLNLDNVTVISLNDFEDEELLKIKDTRTIGEYCWTCTPSIIKYCIEIYNLNSCTYLDADLYFFSNPSVLIDEMGNKSVLITEHRYTSKYDQSTTSGIYCVQFMTFKKDKYGMKVLNWWRQSCNRWCYARHEDGKFGDQKYLDDWIYRFDCIHVLQNLGGGIAPWNIEQFTFIKKNNQIFALEKKKVNFALIFYHFHQLKFLKNHKIDLCHYNLTSQKIILIYRPYLKHLKKIRRKLREEGFNCNKIFIPNLKNKLKNIKRVLNRTYNIFLEKDLTG